MPITKKVFDNLKPGDIIYIKQYEEVGWRLLIKITTEISEDINNNYSKYKTFTFVFDNVIEEIGEDDLVDISDSFCDVPLIESMTKVVKQKTICKNCLVYSTCNKRMIIDCYKNRRKDK